MYAQAESIKRNYPIGTRLILISMDDPFSPVESGTRGTVSHVDDAGQIHMRWDNGRTLALIVGVDNFRRLSPDEMLEEMHEDENGLMFKRYAFYGGRLNGMELFREDVEAICDGHTPDNTDKRRMGCLCPRAELDKQPTVDGYMGPMYDGVRCVMQDGSVQYDFNVIDQSKVKYRYAVLRYETQEIYDQMSE